MEHSSLETFRRQKVAGGLCVLRQVTAHGRTIASMMRRAAERHPGELTPYHAMLLAESEAIVGRKTEEYRLADLIIGNSRYVRDTFVAEGVEPERIVYVPTGCPPLTETTARAGRGQGPLRFLFVGTLSLRKGVLELLDAWRQIGPQPHADLWMAGPPEIDVDRALAGTRGVTYFGNVPRARLTQLYLDADVFVLPTFAEGLSHALLEALSAGLPVVTTPASGCGEFLDHERNGLLLSSDEPEEVASAMRWCLAHRSELPDMGTRSRAVAARWTVEHSNQAHLALIRIFLESKAG